MEEIHLGKRLYDLITNHGYTVEDYAEKAGRTKSALYLAFKKKDINTALMRKAVKILHLTINDFFESTNQYNVHGKVNTFGDASPVQYKNSQSTQSVQVGNDQSAEIERLTERIESLKEQNKLLREMNDLLKSRDK